MLPSRRNTITQLVLAERLMHALQEGDEAKIIEALEDGANPNLILPEEGFAPFHLVVGGDGKDYTALFLQHGANPNIRSSDGLTPLHVAVTWGHDESVELLLQNGADPGALDETGQSALEMAVEKDHQRIISLLDEFASVDEEDPDIPKYLVKLRRILDGEATSSRCSSCVSGSCDMVDEITQGMVGLMRDSSMESGGRQSTEESSSRGSDGVNIKEEIEKLLLSGEFSAQVTNVGNSLRTKNIDGNSLCTKNIDGTSSTNVGDSSCTENFDNSPLSSGEFQSKQDSDDVEETVNTTFTKGKTRKPSLQNEKVSQSREFGAGVPNVEEIRANMTLTKTGTKFPTQTCQGEQNVEKIPENISFTKHRINVTSPDHPKIESRSANNSCNLDTTIATSSSETYYSCEDSEKHSDSSDSTIIYWTDSSKSEKSQTSQHTLNETFTVDSSTVDSWPEELPVNKALLNPRYCSSTRTSTESIKSADFYFKFPSRNNSPVTGQFDDANSLLSDDLSLLSSDLSTDSTIIYEYQYTDIEDGHELIERHFVPRSFSPSPDTTLSSCRSSDTESAPSVASSVRRLSNNQVRQMLMKLGDGPGPVTDTTRRLYQKRLSQLRKDPSLPRSVVKPTLSGYSYELQTILKATDNLFVKDFSQKDEQDMIESFSDPTRTWREGSIKASFNYLLLDSSYTQNLPMNTTLSDLEKFQIFISSVFYIGKGKRSRPYCHFYEALDSRKKSLSQKVSEKVKRILDIWNQGLGVVSLHVYQNVLPVEAYTREAAMIDAMGLGNLTNIRKGDYYSVVSTWPFPKKRLLGTYLLIKAFQIFLLEGERQIQPGDLKTGE